MLKTIAIAVATVLASTSPAAAGLQSFFAMFFSDSFAPSGVVDQTNIARQSSTSHATSINSVVTGAQAVTTGRAGKLARVELAVLANPRAMPAEPLTPITSADALWIDVVRMHGDAPDLSLAGRLATRGLLPESIPVATPQPTPWEFNARVNFSTSGLFFQAGDQFAIVLRTTAPPDEGYLWGLDAFPSADSYSAGSAHYIYGYHESIDSGDESQLVVNEWSDAQFRTYMMAPEPSAIVLMTCGMLVLAHRRRRAQR